MRGTRMEAQTDFVMAGLHDPERFSYVIRFANVRFAGLSRVQENDRRLD